MDNLWARRSNSSKLSLSTGGAGTNGSGPQNDHPTRNYNMGRKGDLSSHSNKNPFNSPAIASPTAGASSAFGLGSGAFASFAKTPKTPGSALDFGGVLGSSTKTPTTEKQLRDTAGKASKTSLDDNMAIGSQHALAHPLQDSWSFWFRPPIPKPNGYGDDYAKTISQIATVATAEDFWAIYRHLERPSTLPHVSDYHFFKAGIRPIWEDEDNKNGGKWIVKLKKGVADRYWEDLLLALIGNQFVGTNDEICGAVLSVRNGEDILSIWTRDSSSGRVLKIKDSMKRILEFPSNTKFEYKSHDSSLAQKAQVDEARKERTNQHNQHPSINSRNGIKDEHTPDKKQAS